jgi:uncharacterized protein (TIGR03032 family)
MTDTNSPEVSSAPSFREVRFQHSQQFLPILRHLKSTLLISTYAAGKVVVASASVSGLELAFHNFEQAMGIAWRSQELAVGSRNQIWFLRNAGAMAGQLEPPGHYDACYLARRSFVTGNIHVHEMGWMAGELWVVNTLFSCLCTLDAEHSFVPRWQPKFITDWAAEDRCHLNGMAARDGVPHYVTAMAETNEAAGWRPNKNSTGVVIDVPSNEVVARGLCMPHSPRWHNGRLWVLNSGQGTLNTVDLATGKLDTVAAAPGYTRGLAFAGQFAFVGMSKIRETAVFGGVPIAEKRDELRCAVVVVDLVTGQSVAFLEFQTGVDEIFDVQVVPHIQSMRLCGPFPEQDEMAPIWIVPPR